ncbi:MAG: hypothetical protein JW808_11405, partial [Victivallales bacterium]|nr:hypothetical protein [Victivallales bacterium]
MSSLKQSRITHVGRDSENKFETRPLNFRIFGRIFSYARPYASLRNTLFVLVSIRAVQLLMITWLIGEIINGPIARGNVREMLWAVTLLFFFTLVTTLVFIFRFKLALELGE